MRFLLRLIADAGNIGTTPFRVDRVFVLRTLENIMSVVPVADVLGAV